jgi:carbon storage regulator
MLIVTRRKGQRIVLGNDIEIVITDISRSGVKVGIVAPSSLTILRGEVKDAVEQANRESLESNFSVLAPALPAIAGAELASPADPAVLAPSSPAPAIQPPVLSER